MSKKIEEWRSIITDCKKYGLPQRKYCRKENLSYPTFSYWRTKINKIDSLDRHESEVYPFVRRTFPRRAALPMSWNGRMG